LIPSGYSSVGIVPYYKFTNHGFLPPNYKAISLNLLLSLAPFSFCLSLESQESRLESPASTPAGWAQWPCGLKKVGGVRSCNLIFGYKKISASKISNKNITDFYFEFSHDHSERVEKFINSVEALLSA